MMILSKMTEKLTLFLMILAMILSSGCNKEEKLGRTSMGESRKIIDISIALENEIISDPPAFIPKITYIDHKQSVPGLLSFFPGLTREDLPGGEAWAYEKLELIIMLCHLFLPPVYGLPAFLSNTTSPLP